MPTRRSRLLATFVAASLTALLTALGACSSRPTVELAEVFDDARIYVETERIDLGTPPARRHLRTGWGEGDERWAGREDQTFVWGMGRASELDFFVVRVDSRSMTLLARPHSPNGVEPIAQLGVSVNGVPLPAVPITPGWQQVAVPIPSRILRQGANRIRFEYPPSVDRTGLQLAIDSIRFSNATVTALPRRGLDESGSISLPYLSGIEYELQVDPGAELLLGGVRSYGRPLEGVPGLRIRIDTEKGQQNHSIGVLESEFTRPAPIAIDVAEPGPVTITLMAVPPESFYELSGHQAEQPVGVELVRPRVRGVRAQNP